VCRTLKVRYQGSKLSIAVKRLRFEQQAGWYRGNSLSSLIGREGFLYPKIAELPGENGW